MLANYLKIAFRLITRQKAFALINIFGLTLGLIGFILVMLYVKYELGFDKHNEKIGRIHQVVRDVYYDNTVYHFSPTPYPFRDAIVAEYPEIEKATRLEEWNRLMIRHDDKTFEEVVAMADKDVFDIFTFEFLEGNSQTALPSISSIAISKRTAQKYFGNEPALGKTLQVNGKYDFMVSAVYDNFPITSTMRFDVILPVEFYKDLGRGDLTSWGSNSYPVYILLREGTDVAAFETKLKPRLGQQQTQDKKDELFLHAFNDIHLHNYRHKNCPVTYVYIFGIIGVVILALAGMNYINLVTARSVQRAKEIGIRKSIGAGKSQVVIQFLGESILFALIALNFAVLIVELILPWFNVTIQKQLSIDYANPLTIISLLSIAVFAGLAAGAYPAFYLAKFNPAAVLKNSASLKGGSFKSVLVIVQFTISIALIITTTILNKQFNYLLQLPVGFEKDNIFYFKLEDETRNQFESFAKEMEQVPNVVSVTSAGQIPTEIYSNGGGFRWEGKDPNSDVLISLTNGHDAYPKTFGMEMVAGRFFQPGEVVRDTANKILKVVVNERMTEIANFKDPIGKIISRDAWSYEIIGVIKNFNFLGMRNVEGPLMIFSNPASQWGFIKVAGDMETVKQAIMAKYTKLFPQYPPNFQLLEDRIALYHGAVNRMTALFSSFTLMAILISCLGLYGLASFIAEQRKKEMGIRKSLGATTTGLALLMLKDFAIWILIANLIAVPLAWYYGNDLLSNYNFRTEISWWIFAVAVLTSAVISTATVLTQVLKTSRQNPALVLKYE
jgi:ABC-type antimicrobial peptide transport system permease subunit